MSQIHSFILSRLPDGEAKEKFLRSLIDFDTPGGPPPVRSNSNKSVLKSFETMRSSSRSSNVSSNVCLSTFCPPGTIPVALVAITFEC